MNEKKQVLVTGISGKIGSVIVEHLADAYELSGLDRSETDTTVPTTVADICDMEGMLPAFEGVHTVVHLAADPSPRGSWESILSNNIIGTRNVFEAARSAGVSRVVYASSHHAASNHALRTEPYKAIFEGHINELRQPLQRLGTDLIRPTSNYGVSKVFGEALGSFYHDEYGMSVICMRIGWMMASDDPTFSAGSLSLWLSQRDAAQLIRKAIDASPSVGFTIVNGESNNTLGVWDLSPGLRSIGFEPEDNAGDTWTDQPGSPSVL